MNKLIILFFIFIVTSINSQGFKGIIEYGKTSIEAALSETEIKRKKENPEQHKRFQIMKKMISDGEKKLTFQLKFINNESYSMLKPIIQSDDKQTSNLGAGPFDSGKYYNKDERILQLSAYGELFLIKKPKLNWTILKDFKKIGNYNCYKATTEIIVNSKNKKHIITAWFTPEIPVSFGPLGYDGLPGLILELEAYKGIYYAKKITLNTKEEIIIEKPIKGIKVTEKEFQNIGSETLQKFKKK